MTDGKAGALLLRLSENEECTDEYRAAFKKVILDPPPAKGDARWTPLKSYNAPSALLIKALLQCHVIQNVAELSPTLELAAYRHKQPGRAFSAEDIKDIATRLVPALYIASQFADERARWCGTNGLLISPNDGGKLFDLIPRDGEPTLQAAIRRDEARLRAPRAIRTVVDAVVYTGARATLPWSLARGIFGRPHVAFLQAGTGDAFWIAVARCVVAQFISERTIQPAYDVQAWDNARAIWRGPPEQDVEADMASALALVDLAQDASAALLDRDVYTPIAARLTALRELKANHFGKPAGLFSHLLSVLIGDRARWVGTYALDALVAQTAATDLAQVNAAFGADPEAQLETAQRIWNYATQLEERNRDAFARLWAALVQRVRYAIPVKRERLPWAGAMCSRSGWVSSQRSAATHWLRGWASSSSACIACPLTLAL